MGIHVRFWHASADDMQRMLRYSQVPNDVVKLAKDIPHKCKSCRKYARTFTNPHIKIKISVHFNEKVLTDLFFLFDKTYVVLLDDCIRYKLSLRLLNKTPEEWMNVVFSNWIRIFGPMKTLQTDQEGALVGWLIGSACDRFNIKRELIGTDAHNYIVESHIRIIKVAAMKLKHNAAKDR